jgi:glycosyltransferase involved in cell wall biosynthesis
VSVIICARNESENLKESLEFILNQDYPQFEVIVVDDGSTDGTKNVLENFSAAYSHLRVINIDQSEKSFPAKKGALEIGIRNAKHDFILLTDADCTPASNQWVRYMVSPLHHGKKIVLGYSPYEMRKTFLNTLIRMDTVIIAMQYFSFVLIGKPYMGVGRNMAYHKSIFNPQIFSDTKLLSGDDDLLIQNAATASNTAIQIEAKSFMVSKPKESFKEWYKQKTRHLQTSLHYKWSDQFLLILFPLSHAIFYSTIFFLLWNKILVVSVLAVFVGRLLIQAFVYHRTIKRLRDLSLWKTMLAFDLIYMLLYVTYITTYLCRTILRPSWK